MKSNIFFSVLFLLLFLGCASTPDLGIYNQGNNEERELVTLMFDRCIQLMSINGERFRLGRATLIETGFIFKMPAGEHLLTVDWVTGLNYWSNIDIIIKVEPGKKYRIQQKVSGLILTISVIDVESKNVIQSVTREFTGVRYI
jgi:hypothetical protein